MTVEERIYEANKVIEWLVNGYFVNCVMPFGVRGITSEWIVENYNVEQSYFKIKK